MAVCGPAAAEELSLFAAASLTEAVKEIAAGLREEHRPQGGAQPRSLQRPGPPDQGRRSRRRLLFRRQGADGRAGGGRARPRRGPRGRPVERPRGRRARVVRRHRLSWSDDLRRVRRLALADPQAVPAGVYARTWLESLGLWKEIADKVVPALNVRAALSAVESENADAGIVYRTDAAVSKRVKVAFTVPARQGAVHRLPARRGRHVEERRDEGPRPCLDFGGRAHGLRPPRLRRSRRRSSAC